MEISSGLLVDERITGNLLGGLWIASSIKKYFFVHNSCICEGYRLRASPITAGRGDFFLILSP